MYDESARFVHHDQDFIFEDDRYRNRFRDECSRGGSRKVDSDPVSGARAVALSDRVGSDSDPALRDQ
jgi:hypothetical protein